MEKKNLSLKFIEKGIALEPKVLPYLQGDKLSDDELKKIAGGCNYACPAVTCSPRTCGNYSCPAV